MLHGRKGTAESRLCRINLLLDKLGRSIGRDISEANLVDARSKGLHIDVFLHFQEMACLNNLAT